MKSLLEEEAELPVFECVCVRNLEGLLRGGAGNFLLCFHDGKEGGNIIKLFSKGSSCWKGQ